MNTQANIQWTIRAATSDDAQGLQAAMLAAYTAYLERMDGHRLPPMDVDYALEIENYPVWVVVSGDGVLGGLVMSFENRHAAILNIAIHPDVQGMGIGGDLMRFAEMQARNNNCAELNLTTHTLLSENISLYRYFGFVETARQDNRIRMSKTL